ncbi:MAG: adenosylmethionine--8-amino-7-oxononanoate transaminase [Alphaproteobacteria bacterium]|nr:adenosylmethionine--8-amino-7-oxononanoate transaminase [Alphaproteobacteria bacterium]
MNSSYPSWFAQGFPHIWLPYTQMKDAPLPQPVVKTDGSRIYLADGTELIDGIASWWTACHGYNHPHIVEAMMEQVRTMPHVMFSFAHEQAYTLADRLVKLAPEGLNRVFFTDSGSTAVETAMKMAVQYWHNRGDKQRNKFIAFKHAYHGDTMGCMSLSDPEHGMHRALNHHMPRQYYVDIPSDEYTLAEFAAIIESIHKTLAGVIIEPLVQGAGGMRFHAPDILAEIDRICKQYTIPFIADEIFTGFCRTGSFFACNQAGISPDMMCIGKALTGGTMTLAACLAKEYLFEGFLGEGLDQALMSGPTYMGNPLACAAANASLDLFENEPRLDQANAIEHQLQHLLKPCMDLPNVKEVRVMGAIGAVQLHTSNRSHILALRQQSVTHGVFLRPFDDVIYIAPALTISRDELSTLAHSVFLLASSPLN